MRAGYLFNHADVVGGGELSFLDLVAAVRAHGVEPVAFVPGPGEVARRLECAGVETVHVGWPPLRGAGWLRGPATVRRLAVVAQGHGLRLLHANGARCMLYAGPAARRLEIPCLWHVRVLQRDGLLDRLRARWAATIVANSGAVAASLGPLAGTTPVVTIYNGFDVAALQRTPAVDLEAELGVPPGRPVVLGAGRFTRWKRFEDLLCACAMLRDDGVHCTLVLAGAALPDEADYEAQLRRLAADLDLRDAVFAGWRDDVPALMKAATVFVLPSEREPFGRVLVEAWACGRPVVATRGGGPAELVHDGVDGLLAASGNPAALAAALRRLLADPALVSALSAAGRERARQFDLDRHAAAVRTLYDEVLA